MNFKKNPRTEPTLEPIPFRPNMQELAKEIERDYPQEQGGPEDYAPPARRQEATIQQIKTFGELPTKELDAIIAASEAEINALKADAQIVRDLYMKYTAQLASNIERLNKGVRLSMETLKQLRAQCAELDAPVVEKTDDPTEAAPSQ